MVECWKAKPLVVPNHGEWAGGPIGGSDAGHYVKMLAANAVELLERIRPGDIVLVKGSLGVGMDAVVKELSATAPSASPQLPRRRSRRPR